MKNLFDGIKRAKARTILSMVIALAMALSIGVCSYLAISPMAHSKSDNPPDMQMSQQADSNVGATAEDDNNSSTNDEQFEKSEIPNDMKKQNNSIIWQIALIAIIIIGALLLFIVNSNSTKNRLDEFLQILSTGVPINAIKKQLFIEAFVIVLIAGIIGGGIGVAIAEPISRATMTQRSDDMQQFDKNQMQDKNFNDENSTNENTTAENSTNENSNIENSNTENSNDNEQGNFGPQNKPDNMPEKPTNDMNANANGKKNNYATPAIITAICIAISSVISGVSCYLPITKIKKKESANE